MEMIKIYILKCNKTGDIRYVGYTKKTLQERLLSHLANVREAFDYKRRKINKRLSWLKSVECDVSIIEIDKAPIEDLHWIESMYISLFKSWGFKLTNMTTGGEGGNTWKSLNHKQQQMASDKISKANKGKKKPPRTYEHRSNLSKNHKSHNKKWIDDNNIKKENTIAKNKEILKLKRKEEASKVHLKVRIGKNTKKVRGTHLILGHSIIFNSTGVVKLYLKVSKAANIVSACKGKIPTAYGYKWEYVD